MVEHSLSIQIVACTAVTVLHFYCFWCSSFHFLIFFRRCEVNSIETVEHLNGVEIHILSRMNSGLKRKSQIVFRKDYFSGSTLQCLE